MKKKILQTCTESQQWLAQRGREEESKADRKDNLPQWKQSNRRLQESREERQHSAGTNNQNDH